MTSARQLPGDPEVTATVAAAHGLSPADWDHILEVLGREPTFAELGAFSVMWSEHCSYRSSRALLAALPTRGPRVLKGPGENAGAVDVGDGLAVCFKMESHNHPSCIEPFQGAATGVGGILRDVFAMNARPIALLDSLRFGSPDLPRTRRLVRGVVEGIAAYGNCVGVPTVGGEIAFHPCYDGNVLVNVMAVGLARSDRIATGRARGTGNPLIYAGSPTGRDGIHGATMASGSFEEGREGPRPTVQVGDPYTEKLLIEACLELMEGDAVVAIQDMGAAGLTSSSVEMAARGGTGLLLDLDRVPRREPGMSAYEILLSESQERMLVVAQAGRQDEVVGVFRRWGIEAAVVGAVTDGGLWTVLFGGEPVACVPASVLAEGAPAPARPAIPPSDLAARQAPPVLASSGDCRAALLCLLASPGIADKRWAFRQYDHAVRLGTLLGPGAADAAVLRLPGTRRALALCTDGNHLHVHADPFLGAQGAVAEAARNVACTGAEPIAATDCLNLGNPERPQVMWELERCVAGLAEGLRELGVPVVSGNVSLYNETGERGVHPTPVIGMLGLLPDGDLAIGMGLPHEAAIVLLGTPRPEPGASAWARVVCDAGGGKPPPVHWEEERALLRVLAQGVRQGLILAAHDVADGGLAVALAEMALAGGQPRRVGPGVGCRVELPLPPDPSATEQYLFGETHGCAWVAVPISARERLAALAREAGCPYLLAGHAGGTSIVVASASGVPVVELPVREARAAWSGGLCAALGLPEPPERPCACAES